jgi:deazaflavin-dependent oxidoreductase (nitroreductase family)
MNGRHDGPAGTGPFPEVAWGRRGTAPSRVAHRLAGTAGGSWLIRTLVPVDRWLLHRSAGRYTVLGPFGTPLLLLTTTGARTGQPRTTPVVYVTDGDGVLLAASNFGRAGHPAWSTNLLAHPAATVAVGGRTVPVTAQLLEGDARDRAWHRFTDLATTYDVYRSRTDRTIRMFRLARRPAGDRARGR